MFSFPSSSSVLVLLHTAAVPSVSVASVRQSRARKKMQRWAAAAPRAPPPRCFTRSPGRDTDQATCDTRHVTRDTMEPGGGESNVTSDGGEDDAVTEALVLAQLVASSTNLILIFVYWTYLLYASISRCVQTPL